MARTNEPNSATSQFYINCYDHPFLDFNSAAGFAGYCVFGQVISGMNVVDQIAVLPKLNPAYANGLTECPYYGSQWVYTYAAQVRVYVAANGNDTTGLGGPESPVKTIQKGIDLVSEPGHVVVKPGTYTSTGNRDLEFKGKSITVRPLLPRDPNTITKVVINCQGSASGKHRAFYLHNAEGPNSVVQGFTIMNGYHDNGGAIYCNNSSPTIRNCTIIHNAAVTAGGGIFCYNSGAFITNCSIAANTAGVRGGALSLDYGSNGRLMNSILWNNLAPAGHEIALAAAANPSVLAVSYSDVSGGPYDLYAASGCLASWDLGNLDIDPCFINPDANDYHLQSARWQWAEPNTWVQGTQTSPCIDAGNPGSPPSYEFGSTSVRVNMGADGASTKAAIPPEDWQLAADIDNDGFVNLRDYAHCAASMDASGADLYADISRDRTVNLNDFAYMASGWLKNATWYWPDKTDMNDDRAVNFRDFSLLASTWLAESNDLVADLNGDSIVNMDDAAILSQWWLQQVPR